jgi:hypothetical protein
MALIAEKDACIALIQNPVETTWEKLQKLVRQREQLKHGLLVQDSGAHNVDPQFGSSLPLELI